jgi:hypothetical protein
VYENMNLSTLVLVLLFSSILLNGMSCTQAPNPDDLDSLGSVSMTIRGQTFKLWIADSPGEQANGLMFVSAERMAKLPNGSERGMIFVFDHEHELSFWMKNTIIPLDIAYVNSQGTVVQTYTMAALDDRPGRYPSGQPARYAIEVNAGVWRRIGLKRGDQVEIPSTLPGP